MAVSLVIGCAPAINEGGPAVATQPFADELAGWTADGDVTGYDTESIFSYIDGHAEVYLAYGMKRCVSRRYLSSGSADEIVVDLFEMASPADAFGVFSHDRAGEEAAVGQGGIFRHGWLSFWKGSWYGSVYATGGGDGVRQAVLDVGRAVADALEGGGGVPELVARMPSTGLDPASVCYLRSPQILNAHVFVGGDNPFGLGPGVQTVVGKYDLGGAVASLVLTQYPDESAAVEAARRIAEGVPDDGIRPAMVVGRRGVYLAAVVGVLSDDQSAALLEAALGGGA